MKILVVLGKRLNNDGSFHKEMYVRCDAAYRLLVNNEYDLAILSGGLANRKTTITEAQAMFDYLTAKGIPKDKFVLEETSKTTRQNAKYTVPILLLYNVDKVYICSSVAHLKRPFNNPINLFYHYLKKATSNLPIISVPAKI